MKKDKIALWVFWLVFFALTINWVSVKGKIHEISNRPPKPMLTQEQRMFYISEQNRLVKELYEKGEEATLKDFWVCSLSLIRMQWEAEEYANSPLVHFDAFTELRSVHMELQRRYLRRGQAVGEIDYKAREEAKKEIGFVEPDVFGSVNLGLVLRGLLMWLLKAWFVGFCFVPFVYISRCWQREESAKELILMQPLDFLKNMILWPLGMMFGYPDGTFGVAREYHRLKNDYVCGKEWHCRLSDEEEQMLWQQARQRICRFDAGVARVVSYSKTVAFVSTLIIWVLSPFKKGFCTPAQKEAAPVTKTATKAELSGFAQLMWDGERFVVPLVILKLKGNIGEDIGYKLEYNATKNDLREAWFNCGFADWLNIKAGQCFMLYTQSPPPDMWPLVKYPDATDLISDFDIGVIAHGDVGMLSYMAGLINGNGRKADNNKAKDVYARLTFRPLKEFLFGAVYQSGKQPEGLRTKYGFHAEADLSRLHILAEYFEEHQAAKKRGFYVLGSLNISESLQALAQCDFLYDESRKESFTLGLRYAPVQNFLLKLNHVFTNAGNRFIASTQFSF